MKNKILLLTSKKNFAWTSMQEILPLISRQWSSIEDFEVVEFDCDQESISSVTKLALQAKLIVLTSFNLNITKVAKLIREKLSIDSPWAIYLHGQATMGMWPYGQFGLSEHFRTSDFFIGTCLGDQQCLDLSFPDNNFYKTCFSYYKIEGGKELDFKINDGDYVYVGRLSSQKNLDQLIRAFSLARVDTNLHFFGEEDGLGSPNMGQKDSDYKKSLLLLVDELKLNDRVTFHGHKPREDIHSSLQRVKAIAVYPSVHSDENFGMSLARILCEGGIGVCSKWGGHMEHLAHFSNSLLGVTVHSSEDGPVLELDELITKMEQAKNLVGVDKIPVYYQLEQEVKNLNSLCHQIINLRTGNIPLNPSEFHLQLMEQKRSFEKDDPQKIFTSYKDKFAVAHLEAYGMEKPSNCQKS